GSKRTAQKSERLQSFLFYQLKRIPLLLVLLMICPVTAQACRFWVAVGEDIDQQFIVSQLIDEKYSLKNLGGEYSDGWSVGFYDQGDEIVIRGDEASNFNQEFDDAVRYLAVLEPEIIMGHLRRASSGCVEGVPNPHPFRITYNGKKWLFGHNGGMRKQILIDLIGKDFLVKHPPAVCNQNPPESWIDSELYFMLIMKTVKEYDDDVVQGIRAALLKLYANIDEESRYLNFFMSDGETVWIFRKGNSLFYTFDPQAQMTVISSTVPEEDPDHWQEFPEDTLAVIRPGAFPQFTVLK
ncbi:MAG: class II glutamine amidotransferase, partial [Candidatus Omnitrophica bacterium]|nr:class II glutamine amidotransferase [Candidatus Omnitrophota bacterium]